ncbi:MAG: TetR/AcrR family transcriptional regulator [Pleomorphochaeta sp.]
MQIKKEDIRAKILDSARVEFLKNGYNKASLRVISNNANLTKGAIYSYFKNKDALFCELVKPATSFLEAEFSDNSRYIRYSRKNNNNFPIEFKLESFKFHAHVVLDNYDSFKLLLFCAAGSSLESYRERIISLYADQFNLRASFMEKKEEYCQLFVHTLASTYISYLEEIITHNPDRNLVDKYAAQMAIFVDAGINKLNIYNKKE